MAGGGGVLCQGPPDREGRGDFVLSLAVGQAAVLPSQGRAEEAWEYVSRLRGLMPGSSDEPDGLLRPVLPPRERKAVGGQALHPGPTGGVRRRVEQLRGSRRVAGITPR